MLDRIKKLTRTQWLWIIGTFLVLGIIGKATHKSETNESTLPPATERTTVRNLIFVNMGGIASDVMKNKRGVGYELSQAYALYEPLQMKDTDQWGVSLVTDPMGFTGGCVCLFDEKPNVVQGQILVVTGYYAFCEDKQIDGHIRRLLYFTKCRVK